MRRWLLLISASAVLVGLAACGGNTPDNQPAPTSTSAIDPNIPTPVPGSGEFDPAPFSSPIPEGEQDSAPTADPMFSLTLEALGAPIRPSPDPNQTTQPFAGVASGVTMPPPGVAVTGAAPTTGPDETDPYAQPFSELRLTRAGGPTDDLTEIRVLADGSVTLNGELVTVLGPQQINALDQQLNEVRILDLQGTFAGTFQSEQDYLYVLLVEKGGASRSIRADDQLIPPELRGLVDTMFGLIQDTADRPPRPDLATQETP